MSVGRQWSLINILFKSTFDKIKLFEKDIMSCVTLIHGFTRGVMPSGIIQLPPTIITKPKKVTRNVNFMELDCLSMYNYVIGRPALLALRVEIAIWWLIMKFLTLLRVRVVKGDQKFLKNAM